MPGIASKKATQVALAEVILILDSQHPPEVAACQLAFELSAIAAGILTLQGRPVWFSPAFPALLGYTPEEFSQQSAAERIHPEDLPAFLKRVQEAALGKPSLEISERRYRHKKGHYLWLSISTNFIHNAEGRPTHILGIFQDISDRKNQEQRLAAAAKMSALGQMAGGLAHEIINPLAIIHGNAILLKQLAKRNALEMQSLLESAKVIEQTSDRISKIVKSLRAFARDVVQDPFQTVSVASIVTETAELCRDRFQRHAIDFQVEPIAADLEIECRPVQISQVLLNLLNNAFDAVEKLPNPWIKIAVNADDTHPKIIVTDSGPGIPAAIHDKLFQPFFTTKDVGKGTGLGLSVSNGIVETHAGSLMLDVSQPHTSFVVQLPKLQKHP